MVLADWSRHLLRDRMDRCLSAGSPGRSAVQRLLLVLILFLGMSVRDAHAQELLWFSQGMPTAQAQEAVKLLEAADLDGLNLHDYQPDQIRTQLDAITRQRPETIDPMQAVLVDQQLTRAMERFLSDLAIGRVSPKSVHQDFDDAPVRDFDAQAYLRQALASGDLSQAVAQAAPKFPLYPLLKQWLARFRQMQEDPSWLQTLALPAGNKLEPGQPYADLGLLRQRLIALGDLPQSDMSATESGLYDGQLVEAVRSFQQRHGLTVDGIIGRQTLDALNVTPAARARQIELSMERVRWTPLQHGDRLLVVNIPGFTLYGYETDRQGNIDIQLEMKVVIGKALRHSTPLFDETMRYIEFSPYWNIPPSIARSETIPAIKRDPGYFARQQLEFVDGAGKVHTTLTQSLLEQAQSGKVRIRQRPGPHNALGDIKFVFPNNMNIFMHHTPATQLFSQSRRDFSHGCIRVEDPVGLAKFVLAKDGTWDEQRIRSAMSLGRSNTTTLKDPVPVVIAYSTVMARNDGKISFYADIYGHDQRLDKALQQR